MRLTEHVMHAIPASPRNLSLLSKTVNTGKEYEGARVPPISYISVVVGDLFDENISGDLEK